MTEQPDAVYAVVRLDRDSDCIHLDRGMTEDYFGANNFWSQDQEEFIENKYATMYLELVIKNWNWWRNKEWQE